MFIIIGVGMYAVIPVVFFTKIGGKLAIYKFRGSSSVPCNCGIRRALVNLYSHRKMLT